VDGRKFVVGLVSGCVVLVLAFQALNQFA